MNKQQMSLKRFFGNGKRPSQEPEAENTTFKKQKATFNRQGRVNYGKQILHGSPLRAHHLWEGPMRAGASRAGWQPQAGILAF